MILVISKKSVLSAVSVLVLMTVLFTFRANAESGARFLRSCGWIPAETPLERVTVRIPTDWDAGYQAYNALQQEAGFDLSPYRGKTVLRESYEIKNAPFPGMTIGNLLFYQGRVIGGDVSATAASGAMLPLKGTTYAN